MDGVKVNLLEAKKIVSFVFVKKKEMCSSMLNHSKTDDHSTEESGDTAKCFAEHRLLSGKFPRRHRTLLVTKSLERIDPN